MDNVINFRDQLLFDRCLGDRRPWTEPRQ